MVFSFYYTDKIALMVQSNNPIMKQINQEKEKHEEKSVNAIINEDKIIPGKNGLTINVEKSFSAMKSFNAFNSYYLIYDQVKPDISLNDNKDKIITNGNLSNKNISIILEYNEKNVKYLENYNIKGDVLIKKDNFLNTNKLEMINNDFENYNEVEILLNRSKLNNNLCLAIEDNKDFCQKKNKYLINSELVLSNDNVFKIKNSLKNGSIIIVKEDTNISNLEIILKQAKFKGLNVVYLSKLISEENIK